MTEEEILRYIFTCVCYKHDIDISPQINKYAYEKENLLFKSAVEFLKKLDKENKVFIEESVKPLALAMGCFNMLKVVKKSK